MKNIRTSGSIHSISQEKENYIRMNLLLFSVCPRAVRALFDSEFYPSWLDETISKAYSKLKDLKAKRIINQAQWNVLFPLNGRYEVVTQNYL